MIPGPIAEIKKTSFKKGRKKEKLKMVDRIKLAV